MSADEDPIAALAGIDPDQPNVCLCELEYGGNPFPCRFCPPKLLRYEHALRDRVDETTWQIFLRIEELWSDQIGAAREEEHAETLRSILRYVPEAGS